MSPVAFLAFNAVLLLAAASDVRHYRIPNLLPLLLAAGALLLDFPASLGDALSRAASVAIVAPIGGGLWRGGLLGGGDLKLLAACALWTPLGGLAGFAMALGLASGLQGASALAIARLRTGGSLASAAAGRLPYALSIAAAGLAWSWTRLAA